MPLVESIERVAVIDDNLEARDTTADLLFDAGVEPVIMDGHFPTKQGLLERSMHETHAAVCDYRLRQEGDYAPCDGAQLVADFYAVSFPAILVTRYARIEAMVDIRRHRASVPVLLDSDEEDPEAYMRGLAFCVRELNDDRAPSRMAHRAIVEVREVLMQNGVELVEAFVPAWNRNKAVYFPADMVTAKQLRAVLPSSPRLIAYVNIDAEHEDGLFFTDFELAPEPDENDGLT